MFDRSIPFVGFHTILAKHEGVEAMLRLIEEGLAPMGFNTLVLEMRYQFRCFPEYAMGTVTFEDARRISAACHQRGIRVVPLFPCLSHQSVHRAIPYPLFDAHPELLETPGVPRDAEWPEFALHSWCASNEEIWKYAFPMMDDMIDACEADAFHCGLDELFEVGSCPRCQGTDPALLYARTVRRLYDHLKEKNLDMMIWGDRLLNARECGYSMWEADRFGIYPAFDMEELVPRDIIIHDWHYDLHSHGYPSIEQFMKAGFFVVPSFFHIAANAQHFWLHALEGIYLGKRYGWPGKMGGLLCTNWRAMDDAVADGILAGIRGEAGASGVGEVIAAVVPKGKYLTK